MFNWKNIFRSWRGAPVLILAILAVLWLVSQTTPLFNSEASKVKKFAEEMERVYREDKYGGKTPEETYDLFISALKAGNIELASKYFSPDNQDSWNRTLTTYKNSSILNEFIEELENNRKNWRIETKKDVEVIYLYPYVIETPYFEALPLGDGRTQKLLRSAGKFNAEVKFYKNTFTNVWKIELI